MTANKNLTELLDEVKDETSVSQWHFCVEELLEALVVEVEKEGERR